VVGLMDDFGVAAVFKRPFFIGVTQLRKAW
jgi:hypothetical protein